MTRHVGVGAGVLLLWWDVVKEDVWELIKEDPPDLLDGVVEGVPTLCGPRWLKIPVGGITGPMELEAE